MTIGNMANASSRLVGIDVLRAAAVIGVLASHLYPLQGVMRSPQGVLERSVWRLAIFGDYGVVLFFAISGFVITRSVIQHDGSLDRMRVAAFYRRRVARIGPGLALSIGLGIAALMLASRRSPMAMLVIFGNAPFTASFWLSLATFTFNFKLAIAALAKQGWGMHWGLLWSLSVEEQFYLLFPLLALSTALPRRRFAALGALVILGALSRHILGPVPGLWLFLTPECVDALAIGVIAALMPPFTISRKWSLLLAVLGLCILIAGTVSRSWTATPLLIAVGAALVMLCCQNGAVFTHRPWRLLARIGRVSYGIYLFHPLVLWGLAPFLRGMAVLPTLALFVAAAWIAAETSFALVEQPAGRWIRNHWSAPRTRTGDPVETAGS